MGHTDAVVEDFVVARNAEAGSKLPYLLRLPLGRSGVVLKSRETWPRTGGVAAVAPAALTSAADRCRGTPLGS